MRKKNIAVISAAALITVAAAFVCLFVGSSGMSFTECVEALFGKGSDTALRIVRGIRLPRVIAAIVAGAGLSVSGLIMQTCLDNGMASPSTLGVSNAAVFGANIAIIAFAGGFLSTGNNLSNYAVGVNPFAVSAAAFAFAAVSSVVVLALCGIKRFRAGAVVLAGIAIGSIWTAATTLLQFRATDVGLSAAVIWSFGDLGRATFRTDLIMFCVTAAGLIFFALMSWRYNALLGGESSALGVGVDLQKLRFVSLLAASLIIAVCVSFLGMIGFVGMICPHVAKRLLGRDHRLSIPLSALSGSLFLLVADAISRTAGGGSALPVGAVTSLFGAPFFLALIFLSKRGDADA